VAGIPLRHPLRQDTAFNNVPTGREAEALALRARALNHHELHLFDRPPSC